MQFNLVVMCGRLAAPVELRTFDSGTQLARLLLTIRSDEPLPRVDVIPVSLWNPSEVFLSDLPAPGRSIFIAGAVQRRFWDASEGRRSRIEIVAGHVEVKEEQSDDAAVS
jgi:single-strand DNA-binding protein